MELVRIGLVGFGAIGASHAAYLGRGEVSGAVLSCICDVNPDRLKLAKELYPSAKLFDDYRKMIRSGETDAVFVATPHYDHPKVAIDALQNGLHVLIEKPAGVYTKQVLK